MSFPSQDILLSNDLSSPDISVPISVTDNTPMIIPNAVKKDRSLLERTEDKDILKFSIKMSIIYLLLESLTIFPSNKLIVRCMLAILSSWVTSIIVFPASCRSSRIAIISLPLLSQGFVGSSARMIDGLLTNALAIATRCLYSPDNSFGLWCNLSDKPTLLEASL